MKLILYLVDWLEDLIHLDRIKFNYNFTEIETAFTDDVCSYASNEIAINWNAPAVYLFNSIAALLKN